MIYKAHNIIYNISGIFLVDVAGWIVHTIAMQTDDDAYRSPNDLNQIQLSQQQLSVVGRHQKSHCQIHHLRSIHSSIAFKTNHMLTKRTENEFTCQLRRRT